MVSIRMGTLEDLPSILPLMQEGIGAVAAAVTKGRILKMGG
jgi:hypothetical protein